MPRQIMFWFLARTGQAMVGTFLKLKYGAEKVALIINENKTKFVKYSRKQFLGMQLKEEIQN